MAQDLLQGLKDNLNLKQKDGEKNPQDLLASLMDSLKNMPGVGDDQKENLMKTLENGFPDRSSVLNQMGSKMQMILLIGFFVILVLICGCIVWKLNRSSSIHNKRTELKRTEKEQKKIK